MSKGNPQNLPLYELHPPKNITVPAWKETYLSETALAARIAWLMAHFRPPKAAGEYSEVRHGLSRVEELQVITPETGETKLVWGQIPHLAHLVKKYEPGLSGVSTGGVTGKGLLFKRKFVWQVIDAMMTRPFVLLAGVSGSGKTQLATALGKSWAKGAFKGLTTARDVFNSLVADGVIIDTDRTPNGDVIVFDPGEPEQYRFASVPVRSDWTDATHLWGYQVPIPGSNDQFFGTECLDVFVDAREQRDAPHFVLLDEMNLSRPEYYASDLLSAMELMGRDVIEIHKSVRELSLSEGRTVPRRLSWPEGAKGSGLLVVGTLNVDETTFQLAPKVLDRAKLLEFNEINHIRKIREYEISQRSPVDPKVKHWVEQVQNCLTKRNLHLGYRSIEEILETVRNLGPRSGGLPAPRAESPFEIDDILNLQLRNKVLPRVRGSKRMVEPILQNLWEIAGEGATPNFGNPDLLDPKTEAGMKIKEMMLRASEVGFTSYFA